MILQKETERTEGNKISNFRFKIENRQIRTDMGSAVPSGLIIVMPLVPALKHARVTLAIFFCPVGTAAARQQAPSGAA